MDPPFAAESLAFEYNVELIIPERLYQNRHMRAMTDTLHPGSLFEQDGNSHHANDHHVYPEQDEDPEAS